MNAKYHQIVVGCAWGILAAFSSPVFAQPTAEDQRVFFATQRQEKKNFEKQILSETDSRAAAIREFDDKSKAERLAFNQSLREADPEDRARLLSDFNESAREKKKAFQSSLASRKKTKSETALEDFDKKAKADRARFLSALDIEDPVTRSEALRAFENKIQNDRAAVRNSVSKDVTTRRQAFQKNQVQKVRNFFSEE